VKVSVLIPCFNAADYLGEALESVFGQSRRADEVIVVDDGSTDASADVVRRYGARVRYVRQENGGIAAARNRGVAEASGDWVAFLDSDDVWPRESLAARVAVVEADAAVDFVYGLTEEFLDFGGAPGLLAPARAAPAAVRAAGAALIRARLFAEIGGFDATLTLGETIDWIARAVDVGCEFAPCDKVALRRRVHGANTVMLKRDKRSDYLRALKASLARRTAASAHD
jgi:glycosyltransferase involved in cell wall biosynthesis